MFAQRISDLMDRFALPPPISCFPLLRFRHPGRPTLPMQHLHQDHPKVLHRPVEHALTKLKNQGVADVCIVCDGLKACPSRSPLSGPKHWCRPVSCIYPEHLPVCILQVLGEDHQRSSVGLHGNRILNQPEGDLCEFIVCERNVEHDIS